MVILLAKLNIQTMLIYSTPQSDIQSHDVLELQSLALESFGKGCFTLNKEMVTILHFSLKNR